MADVKPKVMSMVEEEIKKNKDVTTKELYEKAQKMDKDIAKLTARQFNARYPLQVKRRMKPRKRRKAAPRKTKATRKSGSRRGGESVRDVLLQFAKDVANAEGKAAVVDVIASVDDYVGRIEKASR